MGVMGALNRCCFPELFSFSVALVLVGLRKKFINNFVFPTWALLLLIIIMFCYEGSRPSALEMSLVMPLK